MSGNPDPQNETAANAVEKVATLARTLARTLGVDHEVACPVCRGGWWYDGDECAVSVHAPTCTHVDDEPPARDASSAGGR